MEPTKPYSPCDYVNKARDNRPKPLTREYFATLLEDMNVRFLCEKVREHKPDAERYKIMLPAITWQSYFDGKLRTDANASPTGLFCLDVDIHHEENFKSILKMSGAETAMKWAEIEARDRACRWAAMQVEQDQTGCNPVDDLAILGIHISPSGMGVHVIACCNEFCKSIEENQARLARLLGTSYDAVCKDWARIFFMTPKEDWTYLDIKSLFPE
ncbi:MAG: hypothetical protein IJK51_07865 [Bacteroidaceae bacterium]|nr:hypothetical protein [Bacteroidaceae bacterium]